MREITEDLNKEMDKVTTLLSFLMHQPDLATSITKIDIDRINTLNLMRLKCAEVWSKKMQEQFKDKLPKESIEAIEKIFREFVDIK